MCLEGRGSTGGTPIENEKPVCFHGAGGEGGGGGSPINPMMLEAGGPDIPHQSTIFFSWQSRNHA